MMKNSIYGCGKRCYKTRKEAQEHCDNDQQPYMCWECETWHIKNNQENPIDIFMMKDFMAESLPITNELISLGYYSFNIEPNMILKINPMWKNFEDYLAALKTKFRVKAKKAMQLSNDLVTKEISVLNFDEHQIKMTELYKKVASNHCAIFSKGFDRVRNIFTLVSTRITRRNLCFLRCG